MSATELTAINHVGIRVKDLAASVAFYRHLGFEQIWYDPDRNVVELAEIEGA